MDIAANWGRYGKKDEDDWARARPCVRVIGPPGASSRWHNVDILKYGPPRAPELWSEKGELPEYVHKEIVDGRERWVAGKGDSLFEFCWTELEIVVDGEVIDADRLKIPEDVPIIDRKRKAPAPCGDIRHRPRWLTRSGPSASISCWSPPSGGGLVL